MFCLKSIHSSVYDESDELVTLMGKYRFDLNNNVIRNIKKKKKNKKYGL